MKYILIVLLSLCFLSCEDDCPKEDDRCTCEDRQTHEYDDLPPTGTEGGVCYPNFTCNTKDLVCVNHFCVAPD